MNKKETDTPTVTSYDKTNYDYTKYWAGGTRQYEHESEVIALRRFLGKIPNKKEKTFVDLGGGYGRLMETYAPEFKHSILLDYSVNNLKKGADAAERLGIKNISFVAANLYKLPFRNDSIDAGELIRVAHHIKDIPLLMNELARVLRSSLIFDCPNKRHALAVLRSLFRGTRALRETLSTKPYEQPHRKDSQDSSGGKGIFMNYHPVHISAVASEKGFKTKGKLSVSNFRHPRLKKLLPLKILLGLEKLTQKLGTPCLFGPDIWLLLAKTDSSQETFASTESFNIENLLFCPKCKGELSFGTNLGKCGHCGSEWKKVDGKIWDLRCN